MNRTAPLLATCVLPLTLVGCGETGSTVVTESVTLTTTTTVTTTASSATPSPAVEYSTAPAQQTEPVAVTGQSASQEQPYVVECLEGTPGPALWSDGTMEYSEDCFQQLGGPAYMEAERQSGLHSGGAAVTGYGYAPNGARNPSSGELQTQWGCEQGTVNDPDLCAAVESVIRAADPDGTTYP